MLYPPNVEDAAAHGLRLVSYDRPGYGGSTPHPGRTVGDAAADVGAIADPLGLDRLAVWGHSGGGPHALACAALAGDRLVGTAALAGPAPYDAVGLDWTAGMGESNVEDFALAVAGGDAYEARLQELRVELLGADTAAVMEALKTLLSEVDRAELTDRLAAFMIASHVAATKPGVEGMRGDDQAFMHPWGFDLATIPGPLRIYHGHHPGSCRSATAVAGRVDPGRGGAHLSRGRTPDAVHARRPRVPRLVRGAAGGLAAGYPARSSVAGASAGWFTQASTAPSSHSMRPRK